MISAAFTFSRNDLEPLLARLKNETKGTKAKGLALVMGRAVGTLTRDWLYDLNAERHKHGRNYYAQAADSVTVKDTPKGILMGITQVGFRQRLKGGVIRPKAGKTYLTIPAQPAAYGLRAREFGNLQFDFVLDENGAIRPALVEPVSTPIRIQRRKRKDGTISMRAKAAGPEQGGVMFWLVKKVTQHADPSVLPPAPLMSGTAIKAGHTRIDRIKEKNT